ncbi:MAG: Ig-like domain-containing protein, partial [Myxococcales bacterium]|nr:Ig-like domain-containing protein [Myxococcales bacterium]
RSFRVVDQTALPPDVLSVTPGNAAQGVEANEPIMVSFNRAVDPTRVEIRVFETVHGRVYETAGEGADIREQSSVRTVALDRDHAPVLGHAMNLPGDRTFGFYPSRDYGYGGQVDVDVVYDGDVVSHTAFRVRPLPTLIRGFVANRLGTALGGVEVTVPALGWSTHTDEDGLYSFGFGWSAAEDPPPGLYRMVVNPNMRRLEYGVVEASLHVAARTENRIPPITLPAIDRSQGFTRLLSGTPSGPLADGLFELDLSDARLTHASSTDATVHAQFLTPDALGYPVASTNVFVSWAYGLQPGPIACEGEVGFVGRMPMLSGSYDYFGELPDYALLLAIDPATYQLQVVGVLRVDRDTHQLTSVRPVQLQRLDVLAVGWPASTFNALLASYAEGDATLASLVAALGGTP